jgi:hypothetical protein
MSEVRTAEPVRILINDSGVGGRHARGAWLTDGKGFGLKRHGLLGCWIRTKEKKSIFKERLASVIVIVAVPTESRK